MPVTPEIPEGASLEQIKIVVNALYLCLGHAVTHIETRESPQAARKFKAGLMDALTDGNIDMAIFEDRKTYDFVVAMIDGLPASEA